MMFRFTAFTVLLALLVTVFSGCNMFSQNNTATTTTDSAVNSTMRTTAQTQPSAGTSDPLLGTPATTADTVSNDATITNEQAQSIALSDAGVTADNVQGLQTVLERDDGVLVYDVRFMVDTAKYDYEIDAHSGAILSKEQDTD